MEKTIGIDEYELYQSLFDSLRIKNEGGIDILFFLYGMNIIDKNIKTFIYDNCLNNFNIFDKIVEIHEINTGYYYDRITRDEIELNNIQDKYKLLKKIMNKKSEKFYKNCPYNLFLNSPYWKIISEYKKEISDKKCQLCNSKEYLNTHHNNYKNRGQEYKNLNDLIILCFKCHIRFHK